MSSVVCSVELDGGGTASSLEWKAPGPPARHAQARHIKSNPVYKVALSNVSGFAKWKSSFHRLLVGKAVRVGHGAMSVTARWDHATGSGPHPPTMRTHHTRLGTLAHSHLLHARAQNHCVGTLTAAHTPHHPCAPLECHAHMHTERESHLDNAYLREGIAPPAPP